ncbi:MAG: toll/interleukin-1 receptor domain-containing protein [Fimbriimonadales bacterium]
MPSSNLTTKRDIVFVTHAAPQDNEFALWLSSKLAMAGYRVWVDRRRLRGGDDSWDEIDRVLRQQTTKQIIVFTKHTRKPGVKKELAIGDVMKAKLSDPKFMIGVRNDDIAFADAPPELLRGNILDAYPNWHDCLKGLFEALEEFNVPCTPSPDAQVLRTIVEAREDGRRFVIAAPEAALTNWFPITPPEHIRYYRFDGLQEQMKAWRKDCRIPSIEMGRLAGAFADPPAFLLASSFEQKMPTAYEIPFLEFVGGANLGPYVDRQGANKDIVSLLRQHFDQTATARGLLPVEFASGQTGWFFPDGLVPANKVVCETPDGRRIRRSVSGKFKTLRWHLCLLAKPRIWPSLVYRIHANVVLTKDGMAPMPGRKTHKRRRRLTKSWWNDVWRDRLLAAMSFLAGNNASIIMEAGHVQFMVSAWPLQATVPVSYEASDPPLPSEEDDEGNIVPSAALDEQIDDLDEGGEEGDPDEPGERPDEQPS